MKLRYFLPLVVDQMSKVWHFKFKRLRIDPQMDISVVFPCMVVVVLLHRCFKCSIPYFWIAHYWLDDWFASDTLLRKNFVVVLNLAARAPIWDRRGEQRRFFFQFLLPSFVGWVHFFKLPLLLLWQRNLCVGFLGPISLSIEPHCIQQNCLSRFSSSLLSLSLSLRRRSRRRSPL